MKLALRCQNCFLTPLKKKLTTIFFQKRINLLFIFGLWPKFLLTFYNDLSAGLPKLHLELLDEHFMQWKLPWEKILSLMFHDLYQFFSKKFVKSSGRNGWKFFERVKRTLLGNFVSKNSWISTFVWFSAETLLTFQKIVPVKLAVYLSRWKCFWT